MILKYLRIKGDWFNCSVKEEILRSLMVTFLVIGLAACSAKQIKLEARLATDSDSGSVFLLQDKLTVSAPSVRATKLRAKTRWIKIGSISQGNVFRSKDQVVVLNSFNVHEGYIVVKNKRVVGYYLPVEKTYVKATPVPIKLNRLEQ